MGEFMRNGLSMSHEWRSRRVAGVAAVVLALTVTGSGLVASSSSASPQTTVRAAALAPRSTASCETSATTLTSQYLKPMVATLPKAKVSAAKVKGKAVYFIEPISTPYVDAVATAFTAAAKVAGLVPKIVNGEGEPSVWSQAINTAVSQKAGGILLLSEDPSLIAPALAAAKKAGIPYVDSDNTNGTDPLTHGIFAHVSSNYTEAGKIQGAEMLKLTNCSLNAFYAEYTIYFNLTEQVNGVKSEISSLCGSACPVQYYAIDPTTEATTLEPATLTALQGNANINLLAGVTDIQVGEMEPALKVANKESLPLVGQSCQGPWESEIQSGELAADICEGNQTYIAWAEVDELLRAMTKSPKVVEQVPIQLMVKGSFNAKNPFAGLGSYKAKFETLWGIKK